MTFEITADQITTQRIIMWPIPGDGLELQLLDVAWLHQNRVYWARVAHVDSLAAWDACIAFPEPGHRPGRDAELLYVGPVDHPVPSWIERLPGGLAIRAGIPSSVLLASMMAFERRTAFAR